MPTPRETTAGPTPAYHAARTPNRSAWAWGGDAARTVRRARKLITTELPTGLDEREKADLAEELEALREAIDVFLDKMESM